MRLYYCDHYEITLPPGHKFPMRKYALLREMLAHDRTFDFVPSPLADPETIALIHDPGYVQRFLQGTLEPAALRRIGFPWSQNLVKRSLGSVGGTLAAAGVALETGIGGNLAGGTHHAFRAEGSGFCVFNDIAVGIASLRHQGLIQRAAVVDLDVHQGDGTAALFETDPAVLTISVHGRHNFPFRKRSSKLDIDLPDQCEDAQFLEAVDRAIAAALDFAPHIVFYQSGVDGLATDKLGRLALTHEGLQRRDTRVLTAMKQAGVPCVITLGGGYSDPIELTVEAHANTFRTAARLYSNATSELKNSLNV